MEDLIKAKNACKQAGTPSTSLDLPHAQVEVEVNWSLRT
jgi:hypothetical protein